MTLSPRASDRRVQTVCLLTLTLIAVGLSLAQLQPVLVPFVLALFLSQCLAPLILVLMRRARLPRLVAVTVAVVLAAGVLTGIGFVVAASVNNGSDRGQFRTYQDSLDKLTHRVADSRVARYLGVRPPAPVVPAVAPTVDGTVAPAVVVVPVPDPSARSLAFNVSDTLPFVRNTIGQVLGLVSNSASVLLLMTFLLYGRRWDPDHRPAGVMAGDNGGHGRLLAEIEHRVQQYISVTGAISLLTGLLVGGALAALEVQFAAVWGLLACLLTFIPNFGGVIATLLPLPIVILDPHLSIVVKVLAVAIPTGIQTLIGSLIQPKMTGQSLDLHPVVILLSLLFFSMIWGVAGAFLAVPLTATFKIVFEKIPNTRPLAAALAGNLAPLTDTLDAPADVTPVVVVNDRPPMDVHVTTGGGGVTVLSDVTEVRG